MKIYFLKKNKKITLIYFILNNILVSYFNHELSIIYFFKNNLYP